MLLPVEQRELIVVDPRVVFWPACYMKDLGYNQAVPIEWWISFSSGSNGLLWLMRHPEHSRIIYNS